MSTDAPSPEAPPGAHRVTRPVRVSGDLGAQLADLAEYLDLGTAAYLDPLIRAQIEADHHAHGPGIRAMKAARARVRPR